MPRGFHGGRNQGRHQKGYGRQGNKQRLSKKDNGSEQYGENSDGRGLKNSFLDLFTNSVQSYLTRSSNRSKYDESQEKDNGTFTKRHEVKVIQPHEVPLPPIQNHEHIPKAIIDTANCNGCGDCIAICPVDAISLINGKAEVTDECIGCGACEMQCQQEAIEVTLQRLQV